MTELFSLTTSPVCMTFVKRNCKGWGAFKNNTYLHALSPAGFALCMLSMPASSTLDPFNVNGLPRETVHNLVLVTCDLVWHGFPLSVNLCFQAYRGRSGKK